MSRTKRHISHYHSNLPAPFHLAWAGLGSLWALERNERCPFENGRDRNQTSYINSAFKDLKHWGWGEVYQGKTRQFYKRAQHKHIRQHMKRQMRKDLNDLLHDRDHYADLR